MLQRIRAVLAAVALLAIRRPALPERHKHPASGDPKGASLLTNWEGAPWFESKHTWQWVSVANGVHVHKQGLLRAQGWGLGGFKTFTAQGTTHRSRFKSLVQIQVM